ncbi:ejaculatory bulb-specific protein 3 [Nasonia vitripennis]|uniref:Uncharacterized protein n=1 Tax=Nasonia vitripennis TaxID=7425 RepID=A0A7M7G2M3_NASVI|nr:ejaculatory bulb-specific protein 3 [Nasonia vitripennis]
MASTKRIVILAAGVCLVLALVQPSTASDQKYSGQYDDLDVEAILKNDEERERYYACFMDTGPCHTEAAVFFKSKAPEAVVTSCKYCTDKQIEMFEKIVSWFVDNKPKEWNALIEKTINDARAKGIPMP